MVTVPLVYFMRHLLRGNPMQKQVVIFKLLHFNTLQPSIPVLPCYTKNSEARLYNLFNNRLSACKNFKMKRLVGHCGKVQDIVGCRSRNYGILRQSTVVARLHNSKPCIARQHVLTQHKRISVLSLLNALVFSA